MFDGGEGGRRAFIATTTSALAGLAGCASVTDEFGGSDAGDAPGGTTAGGAGGETTGSSSAKKTNGGNADDEINDGGTPGGGNADDGTTDSENAGGGSLFYATDETTKFGIDLTGNPVLGSPNAPVDCYYWSDYKCPFCRKFVDQTLPKLIENDVRPGEVRMVLLENPYIGKASKTAARMAKCVWRQVREDDPDAYRRWHAAVFDAQGKENSGWSSKDGLLDVARDVNGVNASGVESCIQSNTQAVKSSIDDDVAAADESGIRGTPVFVLFDRESETTKKVIGAQPYQRFEQAIRRTKNA